MGRSVARGEKLFSFYSPDLFAAQQEYLLALRSRDALNAGGDKSESDNTLVAAVRQKLRLWDVVKVVLPLKFMLWWMAWGIRLNLS